jgi:hypothetical protein
MGLFMKDLQPSTHYAGVKKKHVISPDFFGRKRLSSIKNSKAEDLVWFIVGRDPFIHR